MGDLQKGNRLISSQEREREEGFGSRREKEAFGGGRNEEASYDASPKGKASGGGGAAVQDARREMTKTKEQLEEEKKISLSIRIKPLDVEAMDSEQLQSKAKELWDTIVRLETEKY